MNITKKNQASERHKNNNCLRQTREGDPTNITKITNMAKISNEARDSSSEKCYFRYFSYISEDLFFRFFCYNKLKFHLIYHQLWICAISSISVARAPLTMSTCIRKTCASVFSFSYNIASHQKIPIHVAGSCRYNQQDRSL